MKTLNTTLFTKTQEDLFYTFSAEFSDIGFEIPEKICLVSEKTGNKIIFLKTVATKDHENDIICWNYFPALGQRESGRPPLCVRIYND